MDLAVKTPLYGRHTAAGAKMVAYAGYMMPVQYTDIIDEHMAVRRGAGLFDVSHMAELSITGPDALSNINRLLTNEFGDMPVYRVRYSPMCNRSGGVVDDLVVHHMPDGSYLLVVNAVNRDKDIEWIKANLTGNVRVDDLSDGFAQMALQGPRSLEILARLTEGDAALPERYYTFTYRQSIAGIRCMISRTGYTGELGYELYCTPDNAPALWDALVEAGRDHGLIPCGLGARDTLRLEAGMPLYGHEMNDAITPLETGLSFAVKMNKPYFIGKDALVEKGEPAVRRVGLRITGRGIARAGHPVYVDARQVGRTTSGTHLPYLDAAYAMALVDKACGDVGTSVEVEVRGRRLPAEVVPLPFYKRK